MYFGRRAEPKANKKIYDMEIAARMKAMKDRIAKIKPSVDNSAPKGFGESRRNVKKEQQLEERYAQIEHENRVLLARMSDIMSKPGLDTSSNSLTYGHSLNRTTRRKELQRITEENQRILSRIQNARPEFDWGKLDDEAIDHARLVESITEFQARPIGGSYRTMRRSRSEGATRRRKGDGEVDSLAGGASMYQDSFMQPPGMGGMGMPGMGLGPQSSMTLSMGGQMALGMPMGGMGMGMGNSQMGMQMLSGPGIGQGVYSGLPAGYPALSSGGTAGLASAGSYGSGLYSGGLSMGTPATTPGSMAGMGLGGMGMYSMGAGGGGAYGMGQRPMGMPAGAGYPSGPAPLSAGNSISSLGSMQKSM